MVAGDLEMFDVMEKARAEPIKQFDRTVWKFTINLEETAQHPEKDCL
jgi:hypothetical protein